MMGRRSRTGYRQDGGRRWVIVAAVLLIHVAAVVGLVRAFTPDFAADVARSVTRAFTISAEHPVPSPPVPSASPEPVSAGPRDEGAAAAAGRKATPRPVAAPTAPVVIRPTQAPPIAAGEGLEDAAGAAVQGEGTGAAGAGSGTGSGLGGDGTGAGGSASPTVKIAGDINSARDYPRTGRDLRAGTSVTIDLRVGIDGRVASCRVVRPSPDSEADRVTCDLATRRFRFRPAKDPKGNTVEAVYRWRQRWFY